jgi:hypothetical protein
LGGENKPELTLNSQLGLLHELGHHIAALHGWQGGGNSRWVGNAVEQRIGNKLNDSLSRGEKNPVLVNAYNKLLTTPGLNDRMYWNLPGEAASRNIENRFMLGRKGEFKYAPKVSSLDELDDALKDQGIDLHAAHGSKVGPDKYEMRMRGTNEPVPVSALPEDLREAYDRLPATFGRYPYKYRGSPAETGRMVPLTMIGDPKYPWKTEDVPSWDQFDYLGKTK